MPRLAEHIYRQFAGFMTLCKNVYSGGYNVMYDAQDAAMDTTQGRIVCVCEDHDALAYFNTQLEAKLALPHADWCKKCHPDKVENPFTPEELIDGLRNYMLDVQAALEESSEDRTERLRWLVEELRHTANQIEKWYGQF